MESVNNIANMNIGDYSFDPHIIILDDQADERGIAILELA
jgi:hypothetical protein